MWKAEQRLTWTTRPVKNKKHESFRAPESGVSGWSWLTSGGLIKNSTSLPGLNYCWRHRMSFPLSTDAATSQWLLWLEFMQRRVWRVVFWCSITSGLSVCICVCTAFILIGWCLCNHFIWLAKLSWLIQQCVTQYMFHIVLKRYPNSKCLHDTNIHVTSIIVKYIIY